MQTPQPPKGTRDFYPEDMAMREFIFKTWEKTCRRYGFESYDGPMFEHLELYSQKSGEEIEKQLYAFEDKGGRRVALRPELTPTLARMVASRGTMLKRPIRWYSIPALFRYERMQKGRLRQFFQLNMDILGVSQVSADAELIAAVVAMMLDLGFTAEDFSIHVSSRNLIHQLFTAAGVAESMMAALLAILDKQHKIPPEEFTRELTAVLIDASLVQKVADVLACRAIHDLEKQYPDMPAVKELADLFSQLSDYGVAQFAEFDIGIVRGLAYYTGIVFEVFDKKRSMRAIAGGGRYDHLVALYGGPDTPAVGFAAGDVVLGELLKEKGIVIPTARRSAVYVASFETDHPRKAIQMTQLLRQAGIGCEFSLTPGNIGKQLKLANAANAAYVVFVGGDEEKDGKVRLKDMTNGTESLLEPAELIASLGGVARIG
jgi:histidyl-tRNA synthetase